MKIKSMYSYVYDKIVSKFMKFNDDNINSPSHYTDGGIETIDIIKSKLTKEEYIGFLKGNIIKYVTRAGKKGSEEEDYKKAIWYLSRLV